MNPIGDAQALWNNPQELIDLWDSLESKSRHEKLIAEIVGDAGIVADLGCGVGRFSRAIEFCQYYGYDSSHGMIVEAVSKNEVGGYACVDILRFISDLEYDTVILIDVAYHLTEPIQAVKTIINNWKAKRYVFTLLLGEEEILLNSRVVSEEDFTKFADTLNIKTLHSEKIEGEQFRWVVLEYVPGIEKKLDNVL